MTAATLLLLWIAMAAFATVAIAGSIPPTEDDPSPAEQDPAAHD